MGFSGIGPGSILLILLIVIVLFGTKKIRNMGGDLGAALRSFRKGLHNEDDKINDKPASNEKNETK